MSSVTQSSVGRCELSYWKHDEIEKFMKRQLPVISKKGRGCIIDMHSGDGKDTPHPQPDLFSGGSLKTTPTLSIYYAKKYNADVILCEKNKICRDGLISEYSNHAMIIANNHRLMTMYEQISKYPWILVLNDPNGYGKQSFAVMKSLSVMTPVSDFVIVFNEHSLARAMGLVKNNNENHSLAHVRGATRSAIDNEWMFNDNEWKTRLGKRKILSVGPKRLSNEMNAKILLISNFIPGMK